MPRIDLPHVDNNFTIYFFKQVNILPRLLASDCLIRIIRTIIRSFPMCNRIKYHSILINFWHNKSRQDACFADFYNTTPSF